MKQTPHWILILLILISPALVLAQSPTVLHNGKIYTVNPQQPMAEALAIRGEHILMVGSNQQLLNAYPDGGRVDLQGKAVIPGLIDAHGHLFGQGISMLQADLVGTASLEEVMETLKAFEASLPEGAWLTGRGWDQNDWPVKEFPTAADLDKHFPDRPVWLRRIDGHAAWGNTAAMAAAGLERLATMNDPEGGKILRNQQGQPSGIFIDTAIALVGNQVPPLQAQQYQQALNLVLAETARYGLTGVHDAGVTLDMVRLYQQAIDQQRFDLKVYAMIGGLGDTFDYFCEHGPLIDYGGLLTVRSVKLYIDGALGSRGAALLADYADDLGNPGLLMEQPETFTHTVTRSLNCGLQVNTHAIGDRGNRVVLDSYEKAIQSSGRTLNRHRIEHAQLVALEDIPRFASMGIIASMQPTHATSDMYWAEDRVGPNRILGGYAWQAFLKQGARLAFGSDFPVEPVNPMIGFYAAISRQDAKGWPENGWYPDQRLTREQALKAFTLDAAYAAFQEQQTGSLEPGKFADLVILSKDIMQIPAAEILTTEVESTYLNGRVIYQKP